MKVLAKNKKRKLVQDIGPYMNVRYVIYDNMGILEVWFSDKSKALEWWKQNRNRETWAEKRERYRKGLEANLIIIDDILPFM